MFEYRIKGKHFKLTCLCLLNFFKYPYGFLIFVYCPSIVYLFGVIIIKKDS